MSYDYARDSSAKAQMSMAGTDYSPLVAANPTLQENINAKIKYHEQEIERLRKIANQIPPAMLAMNLRDLREAMSF